MDAFFTLLHKKSDKIKSLRDYWQITFVMLNRFCTLSKPPSSSHPYCSKQTISKEIEYQPKSNEKNIPFLHCISSFEGTSYKSL